MVESCPCLSSPLPLHGPSIKTVPFSPLVSSTLVSIFGNNQEWGTKFPSNIGKVEKMFCAGHLNYWCYLRWTKEWGIYFFFPIFSTSKKKMKINMKAWNNKHFSTLFLVIMIVKKRVKVEWHNCYIPLLYTRQEATKKL